MNFAKINQEQAKVFIRNETLKHGRITKQSFFCYVACQLDYEIFHKITDEAIREYNMSKLTQNNL